MRRIACTLALAVAVATLLATLTAVAGTPTPSAAAPYAAPPSLISAGIGSTCALTATGGVKCWGENFNDEIGSGSAANYVLTPETVTGLSSGAVGVSVGGSHACAVTSGGGVRCWGRGSSGELGDGNETDSATPVTPTGLGSGVAQVAVGGAHACAVTVLGKVRCWGRNVHGGLGLGDTDQRSEPVEIAGLTSVEAVTTGNWFTCALKVDGSVWCWGDNAYGQVGQGSAGADQLTPVQVSSLGTTVRQIDAGGDSVCVVTTTTGAKCWGNGESGVLGDGSGTAKSSPVAVSGGSTGVLSISVGGRHTCAVKVTGGVACWGAGNLGQLGQVSLADAPTPVSVSLTGITQVAAGEAHTCALRQDGGVRCWGQPRTIGDGSDGNLYAPTPVPEFSADVVDIGVGGNHTCFAVTDGTVECAGNNSSGELGVASPSKSWKPVQAGSLTSSTQVTGGGGNTCSVNGSGALRCWGFNSSGQLGIGSTTSTSSPTLVTLPASVAQVAMAGNNTCAVLTTGALYCWGFNGNGEVGKGTTGGSETSPVQVLASGVASVSVGGFNSCAILTTGALKCWGQNQFGEVGNGATGSTPTPTQVSGITSGATSVSPGYYHTCATVSGAVKCWGNGSDGRIGTANVNSTTPVTVPGMTSGWVQVALSTSSSCARSSAGAVKCWGTNASGTLGTAATTASSATPVSVMGSGAADIDSSPSSSSMCATTTTGGATCWGSAAVGQLTVDVGFTPKTVTGGNTFWATGARYAPLASWGAYVDQQYLDLLAKTPSAAARTSAVNKLQAGTETPGTFIALLRADADQTGAVDPTARLYFAYFLRIPDKTGLDYWIKKKRGGTKLRSISDSFATSSEFVRRYGSLSNAQFVDLIYENLFQREPDSAGATYWTNKLNTGSESRGGVMAQFSESSEYKRKMANEVVVSVLNLLLLRRQVPQAEFDAAVARLDAPGGDVADLATELLTSATYRNRF